VGCVACHREKTVLPVVSAVVGAGCSSLTAEWTRGKIKIRPQVSPWIRQHFMIIQLTFSGGNKSLLGGSNRSSISCLFNSRSRSLLDCGKERKDVSEFEWNFLYIFFGWVVVTGSGNGVDRGRHFCIKVRRESSKRFQ
jgi:hypothetical protein